MQDEISILELLNIIKRRLLIILSATSITVLALASVLFLFISNKYTSVALVKPAQENQVNNFGGNLGGIASLAGIDINDSSAIDLMESIILSRLFFKNLILDEKVSIQFYETSNFDLTTRTSVYSENVDLDDNLQWKIDPDTQLSLKPSFEKMYKYYLQRIRVDSISGSNLAFISFTHESPIFAMEFLSKILSNINDSQKTIDLNFYDSTIKSLKLEVASARESEVRTTLSQLIGGQLTNYLIAKHKDQYFLETIDPPFIPEQKSSPVRSRILLFSLLISLFVYSLLVILYDIFPSRDFSK